MKKIKAVVLKDATKLTNSQMKEIRGGYEPEKEKEYLTGCSITCGFGFVEPFLEVTCSGTPKSFCNIVSGANNLKVGCFYETSTGPHPIQNTLKECQAIEPPVE